jgi:hypothetical protein
VTRSKTVTSSETVTVPETEALAAIEVPYRKGELRIPNTIVFGLYPLLEPYERLVYEQCYLYTHGFNRNPWLVNMKALQNDLHLSESTLLRTIGKLELKGLVVRRGAKHSGANHERGTLIQVNLPKVVGGPETVTGSQKVTVRETDTVPERDMRKKHERQERKAHVAVAPAPELSVYDIRRIAARFRELHHGESDYTKDRLRGDVRTALIGEGREPDDRLIDEAIG